MRAFLFPLTLFASLTPTASPAATDWAGLLEAGNRGTRFGVALEGREPYRRAVEEPFAPASTAKLFTAGAVLERLGPGFRYATRLRWTEPRQGAAAALSLIGEGDPSWGLGELGEKTRTRLDAIAAALKGAGVTEVWGEPSVESADPRWGQTKVPEGWKESDSVSCGGALAQAFNVSANCGILKISSATSAAWLNEALDIPVELRLRPGSVSRVSARPVRNGDASGFVLEGTWGGPISLALPIRDTRPWIHALFRRALLAQGIRILPAGLVGGAPRQLTFRSPPLSELLKPYLKNSVNFLGDTLLKTLGSRLKAGGESDLLESGLKVLSQYLLENGASRDFSLHDGSGLSRLSRCTPSMVLAFLERLRDSRNFPVVWAALAVAGVDGTLKERMRNTAAAGLLRGKTGTLEGVNNLVGYVPDGPGRFVPFVVFATSPPSGKNEARATEDRVGARLAELHRGRDTRRELLLPFPFVPEHAGMDGLEGLLSP